MYKISHKGNKSLLYVTVGRPFAAFTQKVRRGLSRPGGLKVMVFSGAVVGAAGH